MTPRQLRAELERAGVELWVDGEMLRYRAPAGVMGPELLRKLREQKQDLVSLLRSEQTVGKLSTPVVESATVGQQALWYLHHSDRESPAYNVASAARIHTPIEIHAFRSALESLLARHDSLRTVFRLQQGIPTRVVQHHQALDFEIVDGSVLDAGEMARRVQAEYERPFDLTRGPLLRARLYQESTGSHVFLLVLHHIVFDSWSLWVVLKEFQHFYQKALGNAVVPLPSLEVGFGDYARWQTQYLAGDESQKHWDYWKQSLDGAVKPVELPFDFYPRKPLLRGASFKFLIPNATTERLLCLGREERATPFMTLLAAYFCLLRRYTSHEDVVLGIGSGGRTQPQFAEVIGYFVNTLPIRVSMNAECSFRSVLKQVRSQVIGSLKHQDFPFPLLVKRLNPSRRENALNFCNVMFGLQKPQSEVELAQLFDQDAEEIMQWGDFDISPFDLHQQEGQFDLNLEVLDSGSTYTGLLKYNTHRFEPETIERLAGHFLRLADAIATRPDLPILNHEMLSETETAQLLDWSQADTGRVDSQPTELFIAQFERMATERPNSVAIAAPERLTYRELDRRANQFSHVLREHGVRVGDVVACLLPRCVDAEVLILALFKIGAIYVPVDPLGTEARISGIVKDCGPRLILAECQPPGIGKLMPHAAHWLDWSEFLDSAASASSERVAATVREDDPAYLLYTSGSTGHPKGVVVSHDGISKHLKSIAQAFSLRSDDCVLQFANFTFDPALEQLLTPLSLGASVVVRPNDMWTAHQFWEVIVEEQVTVANLPPAYFRECTRVASADLVRSTSLRLMIVGGDVFPAETTEFWNQLPVQVLNAYGPTESIITATTCDIRGHRGDASIPIGRPKPGMSAFVLTPDQKLSPIGVPGELCLGGDILALGYWRDEELTARQFVPNPFENSPTSRLYKTGDLVRWTNRGELEFLGRLDRQLKINGVRIEPAEIETLLRSLPAVKEVVVVSQSISGKGPRLIAYLECHSGAAISAEEIRRMSRQQLPANMVPDVFVVVEQIPVNASGKVDYAKLPTSDESLASRIVDYAPPRTPIERRLVEIWEQVLKVERIGIHDQFLDLGGGSFDSLRIATLAAEQGLTLSEGEMTPDLLFHFPTIAALAEQISWEERVESTQETS